jgi:hypothetical protein
MCVNWCAFILGASFCMSNVKITYMIELMYINFCFVNTPKGDSVGPWENKPFKTPLKYVTEYSVAHTYRLWITKLSHEVLELEHIICKK